MMGVVGQAGHPSRRGASLQPRNRSRAAQRQAGAPNNKQARSRPWRSWSQIAEVLAHHAQTQIMILLEISGPAPGRGGAGAHRAHWHRPQRRQRLLHRRQDGRGRGRATKVTARRVLPYRTWLRLGRAGNLRAFALSRLGSISNLLLRGYRRISNRQLHDLLVRHLVRRRLPWWPSGLPANGDCARDWLRQS